MLKALTIQDLAVIRQLDVEFESGLTILTGETGAGKSILIEALGLALGDRADSTMVRSTAERASVTATFDIRAIPALKTFLGTNDLEDGDDCILRRVMSADGRSRAFCNAQPVPVQLLKQIGEFLVDIHGQHAHHSLLRRAVMRAVLDEYAKAGKAVANVATAYEAWRQLVRRREELTHGADDVPSRIDLLRFQAEEISALELTEDSLATLTAEHRRVAHAARLTEACEQASEAAFGTDGSAFDSTVRAAALLRAVADIDPRIEAVAELLDTAAINLEEAERELAHVRDDMETDPVRLQEIDHELQTIQDLARKHRCEARAIPARLVAIEEELSGLVNREEELATLDGAIAAALADYDKAAHELSKARARAAKKMNGEITTRLRELGIPHGSFNVDLARSAGGPGPHGADEVDFLVTANPDQPLAPLRKVASGGELSRVSLAIQVATTGTSGVPVLVFDEVDTGIGGPTADVVSRYLGELASHRQILCITHLPQVASAGDHHLSIGKIVAGGITQTTVRDLDPDERVEEVARMLGGQKITQKAREHARELLTH
ncbi:MAG: DNA repair protein RecN [Gammaproteobacteria bacterium]